jgi:hypothetical protein
VTVPAITVSGTNAVDFSEGDNCAGQTLQEGGSCTINVVFDASVTIAESAQLSVGGLLVSLSGAGIDFSVAAATGGSLSATVTQGQTASYSLQVMAIGGVSPSDQVSVSMACAGLPSESFCSSTPQPVVATVTTPGALMVSVNTTAPSQGMALPPINGIKPPVRPGLLAIRIALLWVLSLFVWMRGLKARAARPRLPWLAAQASIVVATVLTVGCGGSSSQSSPPIGGTPPGTYTITLTGTAGSDRHSIQLTLVVNAD